MSYPVIFGPQGEPAIGNQYFNGNGYGTLSDCATCTVTEQRNGEYELYFQYPISGIHYDKIVQRALIRVVPNQLSNAQYFRVYQITKPINGLVEVYAHHISYDLSGAIVLPFTASTCAGAMSGISSHRIGGTEYTFWTDKSTTGDLALEIPTSLRSFLGGNDNSILGVYGGEFEWDNYTVKLHENRGTNRGVTIRYGKNLIDLSQEENCANCYTAVLPFWSGYVDDTQTLIKPDNPISAGTFSYTKILPLDLSSSFSSAPTVADLTTAAQDYISKNNIGVPNVSLEVSFVQLSKTEEFKNWPILDLIGLCDTVNVYFEKLGVNTTAQIVEIVYDCLLERFDTITLGDPVKKLESTLSDQQSAIQTITEKTVSKMDAAIARATKKITGNLGGYVVIHDSNNDGYPDEILILDNASGGNIGQSQHIWRWNNSGLGYSSDYGQNYGLAMTSGGEIVADFITTGTLDGSIIEANSITASQIDATNLQVAAANVTGTLTASQIDATNLQVAAANVTGTITASQIDASNLQVAAANVTGTITASQIDATNLQIASGNVTGTFSANKISGGTIDANTINVQHLNASNLSSGYVSSARISDSSNKLSELYVNRLVVGGSGGSDYLDMYARILWSSSGTTLNASTVSTGSGSSAQSATWAEIISVASSGSTAKFG